MEEREKIVDPDSQAAVDYYSDGSLTCSSGEDDGTINELYLEWYCFFDITGTTIFSDAKKWINFINNNDSKRLLLHLSIFLKIRKEIRPVSGYRYIYIKIKENNFTKIL